VVINTLIGFFQEYKAESSLQALKSRLSPECDVIRRPEAGKCIEMRVKATELVPGDIILLSGGDRVPADARIFEAANFEVDESMLTGESTSVEKTTKPLDKHLIVAERRNIVYSGTIVTHGRGKAVVVETGMTTEMGAIADLIKGTEDDATPIQKKLSVLVKKFAFLALTVSGFTFFIGFLMGNELIETFLFAVASAVSSIPEGLPVVMTITLAVGVSRMANRKAVIRKLHAVDTLGATTVICSDKTGTLTTNEMTVRKIFVDNQIIDVTGVGFTPEGDFEINRKKIEIDSLKPLQPLLQTATLCNDARLRSHIREGGENEWEIYGDPTEGALLVLAAKKGIHKEEINETYNRIDEIPFNSKRKYMATFHKASSDEIHVYLKGAPEVVMNLCLEIYFNGEQRELTHKEMDNINEVTTKFAENALRNLAFATKTIKADQLEDFKQAIERGEKVFDFLGVVGMIDPPRSRVKHAIELCKKAGIKVIMATGDHKLTAKAIGTEIGIHQEGNYIITGDELREMNDKEIDDIIEDISIFARVTPEDKYKIVSSLKRQNHVVAMTGDGVNDAPALKVADVGISMGITGTDVAKESSEMVLTDDNFSSIVNAVEEGRVVFQNVRKVIKYLVCTNIGEDALILLSLFLLPLLFNDIFLIFTPVQLLWVNLVTDGVLDISLAMEGKERDVMEQKPRSTDEPIFNKEIIFNIIYVALFMMVGTIFVFLYGLNKYDNFVKAQTLSFTTLAMFQVFNSLNCRSRTLSVFELGFFSNKYLFAAIIASIFLQILAVYLIPMNWFLGTVPILFIDWLLIVAVSSTVFIGDELRKFVQKKMKLREV
jgi:Ca2+-transporting ATPase